jgi:integrase
VWHDNARSIRASTISRSNSSAGVNTVTVQPVRGPNSLGGFRPDRRQPFLFLHVRQGFRPETNNRIRVTGHAATVRTCRDRVHIKLPREERQELVPPTAAHVEAVYRTSPREYRLPLLWLEWSGARVGSVETVRVGDYDEPRQRVRLRAAASKTRRALSVELHDDLAAAVQAHLGPREDRNPDAALFPGVGVDAFRTAIARACKANGIPVFSPHDLRHRRISLLHRQGRSWAEIGAFVGQRSLKVTADTYTHVLLDDREVDSSALLRSGPAF